MIKSDKGGVDTAKDERFSKVTEHIPQSCSASTIQQACCDRKSWKSESAAREDMAAVNKRLRDLSRELATACSRDSMGTVSSASQRYQGALSKPRLQGLLAVDKHIGRRHLHRKRLLSE